MAGDDTADTAASVTFFVETGAGAAARLRAVTGVLMDRLLARSGVTVAAAALSAAAVARVAARPLAGCFRPSADTDRGGVRPRHAPHAGRATRTKIKDSCSNPKT